MEKENPQGNSRETLTPIGLGRRRARRRWSMAWQKRSSTIALGLSRIAYLSNVRQACIRRSRKAVKLNLAAEIFFDSRLELWLTEQEKINDPRQIVTNLIPDD